MEDFIKAVKNERIFDMFIKANSMINEMGFNNIAVSISGGSDSDIMLDVITKVDKNKKCKYIYMNTGLEYEATKKHIKILEEKYNIKIETLKPEKPIPVICKEIGQPFINKTVSEHLSRLQKINFKWENEDYETLIKKYKKNKEAIIWWCNKHKVTKGFNKSQFNINYKKYLKEFIIENPPNFKISNKCCKYTKKDVSNNYCKKNNIDLILIGERKAEGGARATKKTCTYINKEGLSKYKPLFWLTNEDKKEYENMFNIEHSNCYKIYGLNRTGCVGCPYGLQHDNERTITKKYEPKLSKACESVFKEAYEYTDKYIKYKKIKKIEDSFGKNQIRLNI